MKTAAAFFIGGVLVIGSIFLTYSTTSDPPGKYELGRRYDAAPVSFGYACQLGSLTPEMKAIYNRKRYFTSKVCVHRREAALNIMPGAAIMGRSRLDGSYKVTLRFDGRQSALISRLFDGSGRKIVLYRGDTLLTHLLNGSPGFGGEISTYQDAREDADSAMDQVVRQGDQAPTQSWHR